MVAIGGGDGLGFVAAGGDVRCAAGVFDVVGEHVVALGGGDWEEGKEGEEKLGWGEEGAHG